jgi:ATP-dependent RNA helicase DOB1
MRAYSRVIKRAGLVDRGVVTLKGRVTCEINSHHEVLLTDLIFTGYFNDMTPIEIAAVLSSLCHEEKSSTERMHTKNPRLRQKLEELIVRAKAIFLIFKECKMNIEEVHYMIFRTTTSTA